MTSPEQRLDSLEQRIRRLEQRFTAPAPAAAAAPAHAQQPAMQAVPQHAPEPPQYEREDFGFEGQGFDLARLLTARTLAWVGGLVILAGLALLFAMAIDRGWITVEMRVLSGAVLSGLLLVAASALRTRYGNMEAALAAGATGIAGLFAADVAAGSTYGLISDPTAIVFALLIAVIAVGMALSWDHEAIGCLGLAGAVTAPLVFLEDVSAGNLEIVALVLAAAVVLSLAKRWNFAVSIVATVGITEAGAWIAEHSDQTAPVLGFAVLFASLVTIAGLGFQLLNRDEPLALHAAALLLSGAGLATQALVMVSDGELSGIPGEGLALIGLASVYLLGSICLRVQPLASLRDLRTILWGVALVLFASALPVLFEGLALVSAFAGTGLLIALVGRRLDEPRLLLAGVGYVGIAVGNAFVEAPPYHLFDEGSQPNQLHPAHGTEAIRFGPEILAVLAAVVGAAGIAALSRKELRMWAGWTAAGLAIYAASLGVLWAFNATVDPGQTGESVFQSAQTTVSILWGTIGFSVLIVGLRRKIAMLRTAGFLLFGVALSKLVLYDLTVLTAMARVVSFLVLGLVLLAAAALHQRLAEDA